MQWDVWFKKSMWLLYAEDDANANSGLYDIY